MAVPMRMSTDELVTLCLKLAVFTGSALLIVMALAMAWAWTDILLRWL